MSKTKTNKQPTKIYKINKSKENIKGNVPLDDLENKEMEELIKKMNELTLKEEIEKNKREEIENFKIVRCIFNNDYLCLSNGIIYDTVRNKIKKSTTNPITGYSGMWMKVNGIDKFLYVHHIIYFSFNNIKQLNKNYNIDHKNSIRNDNRLENLQILTHKENINKSKLNKDTRYKEIDKIAYSKMKQRKQLKQQLKQQLIKLNEEIKILNDIVF